MMAEYIMDNGKRMTCTAKAYISGQMAEHMRASTSLTKKKVMESTHILMAEVTKVIGQMDFNTVKEFVCIQTVNKLKEFGAKEKE